MEHDTRSHIFNRFVRVPLEPAGQKYNASPDKRRSPSPTKENAKPIISKDLLSGIRLTRQNYVPKDDRQSKSAWERAANTPILSETPSDSKNQLCQEYNVGNNSSLKKDTSQNNCNNLDFSFSEGNEYIYGEQNNSAFEDYSASFQRNALNSHRSKSTKGNQPNQAVHEPTLINPPTRNIENISKAILESSVPHKPPLEEIILLEGLLQKYKPRQTNTSNFFVPRWCQLTSLEFRYYKNKFDAKCWDVKPLQRIPLGEILDVLKVKLKPQKSTKTFNRPSPSLPNNFLFEINTIPQVDDMSKLDASGIAPKPPISNRERSLTPKREPTPTALRTGHLMPSPRQSVKSQNRSEKSVGRASLNSVSTKSGQSQMSKGGKMVNGVKVYEMADLSSWTSREQEWYAAETKLIFSAGNETEYNQWESLFRYLVLTQQRGSSYK